jgi:hypothetical protein
MVRKTLMALAIGAALMAAVGTRASAQAVSARVVVGAPVVYAGAVIPAPGPGYEWVPAYHRWFYRGPGWGPRFYHPVPVRVLPRPYFRPRVLYHRGW